MAASRTEFQHLQIPNSLIAKCAFIFEIVNAGLGFREFYTLLMVQLIPGLLYVIVLTAIFTVLLVSLTAVSLLSQARAIVRHRYLGSVVSRRNVYEVAKLRPIRSTATAILLQVKDIEANRLLTTFKRPSAMRLYEQYFYIKPYFSPAAYLIRVEDIDNVSTTSNALVVTFAHEDRVIVLQCRAPKLSKWRDSMRSLISNTNSIINN